MPKISEYEKGWRMGIGFAVNFLARGHGDDCTAAELVAATSLTTAKLKSAGGCESDLAAMRQAERVNRT